MTSTQVQAAELPELPRGVNTTEFWLAGITTVISFLVGLGILPSDFAQHYQEQISHTAMLATFVIPSAYIVARNIAKHGHTQAVAKVLTATIEAGRTVESVAKANQPTPRKVNTKA